MKLTHHRFPILLAAGLLVGAPLPSRAATAEDPIEVARGALQADRQAVVTEVMQLTEAEAKAFWPLYHRYRADMETVGDRVKQLVLEYAGLYPDVPDGRAKKMLQELAKLEKKQVSTREWYLQKFTRVLPPAKTLRFAQVESRLDLAVRLDLATHIPLVPIVGELGGRLSGSAAFVAGSPGGVVVRTLEIEGKVTAIDTAGRKLTLISPEGIKQVVKVGPEVINFDQIRVGDQLQVTVTEQLVVQMGGKKDVAGGAVLVALAPEGAKPGGLLAETIQVTGTITAIDEANHTATLKFENGSTRTFPVRHDVNLGRGRIGEKVVFRVTEAVAIAVRKP